MKNELKTCLSCKHFLITCSLSYNIEPCDKFVETHDHICGESCALYNSLGCPYLGTNNTGKYCDEWRCKNGEE